MLPKPLASRSDDALTRRVDIRVDSGAGRPTEKIQQEAAHHLAGSCGDNDRSWWTDDVVERGARWSRLIQRGVALVEGRPRLTGRPPSANGASSFHLVWEVPTGEELVEASVSLVVSALPSVARLYFWALQVSFADGAGAHLGLQWGADPPGRLRHVNWGGYGASGAELSGGPSNLPSSFANPNTRDYDWEPARPYRLRICRVAGGWAGWVDDMLVRCLDAPGETVQNPVVWSEVFADCDHPAVSVRWSDLEVVTRSGRRVAVDSVVASYQSRQEGGCDNISSETDGAAFVQTTNAVRRTSSGASLRVV